MKLRSLYLCSLFIVFLTGTVCGEIVNGGFEISEPNEPLVFELPVGWICENYTAVDSNFMPDMNTDYGNCDNWEIDFEIGLLPFEGESFVILSTDDFSPNPEYAKISQEVEFLEGQIVSGAYFFGTYDYPPFNDYASIVLNPVGNGKRSIILVNIDVGDVGEYSSTQDWQTFKHVFSAEDAGVYDLTIGVFDIGDSIYTTYFAIDGLEVCQIAEYGDVNTDCKVDLVDFSMLSEDWMLYDPNYIPDPNFYRQYETDFDGSHFVDVNDLRLMSENWLYMD